MNVLMPQLGETVTEGTISRWFKVVGDKISAGEALLEIETDKTSMEVESIESGVVAEICAQMCAVVPVGNVIAVIAAVDAPTREFELSKPTGADGNVGEVEDLYGAVVTPLKNFGQVRTENGLRITPLARRVAERDGVDIQALARDLAERGVTKIYRDDVCSADQISSSTSIPTSASISATSSGSERIKLNRMRRSTGAHLAQSWSEVPHVFQAVDVEMDKVERVRKQMNVHASVTGGVRLTYLAFVSRAVCLAVRSFPLINAHMDGDALIVHHGVHLGVAVDLDYQGLVVPVIRNADGLNVMGLAREIESAVERARRGALIEDDLSGGTYTISNSGSFGTLFTVPIINRPQVAILSTDGIRKRPVVVEADEGDSIAIRPVGIIGQSFDHRAFDGAYSAAYLRELKQILETRDWSAEIDAHT
jgi:pyruvate dehydrogenase E2 component (dihydrolipoamide acetyltransferase)